jgi:hypothetical protein
MIYEITLDGNSFSKYLKNFKLGTHLFIRFTANSIKVFSLDSKDFIGAVKGCYKTHTGLPANVELNVKVDYNTLVPKLELLKNDLVCSIDDVCEILTLSSKHQKSYSYSISCEISEKNSMYIDQSIIQQTQRFPLVSFQMDSKKLTESFKALTSVDSMVTLTAPVTLEQLVFRSKKTNNICHDAVSTKQINYDTNLEEAKDYSIYYPSSILSSILSSCEKLKVEVWSYFVRFSLVFEDNNNCTVDLYLPIR